MACFELERTGRGTEVGLQRAALERKKSRQGFVLAGLRFKSWKLVRLVHLVRLFEED